MIPEPYNEPVLNYAPNSAERKAIQSAISEAKAQIKELPCYIGGEKIFTQTRVKVTMPHEHAHVLGYLHEGTQTHVTDAINAALKAHASWSMLSLEKRADIFLKAADLISNKYRAAINAATMLGQSKTVYQAEIDSACELADFLRFNAKYAEQINNIQPASSEGIINYMEYRALEGFVFALSPFNFTAIAGNLPAAPALLGNVVVWKPAYTQAYAADLTMQIFMEAGLPAGVINLVYADGPMAGEIIFKHPDFAGIHFTGSTAVFKTIWQTIGENISTYKSYPRIVGETGGKDFVVAHHSANPHTLATALLRGAFEYQGQKCSAASRAYIPDSLWEATKTQLLHDLKTLQIGSPEEFSNFITAVIDEKSFDKVMGYIHQAEQDADATIIAGGKGDKSVGYFIEPTIIVTTNPRYKTMVEEIFGPVLTVYIYPSKDYEAVLELINTTSPYALTGAVFANDAAVIHKTKETLVNAAGNFYINDKPTGAVVNQQPFGGARASGTNDKAGSILNLIRWVSPRTIKENLAPHTDYRYPFLSK